MSRIAEPLPENAPIDFVGRYLTSLPSPASRTRMARAAQKLGQLTFGSLKLRVNLRRVPWATLDRGQVLELVRKLDSLHPSSQRLHVACLRGVLKEADVPSSVLAAAKPSKGTRVAPGRALSPAELRALERAATQPRDRALLAIASTGGLRVSELVGLDASDWAAPVLRVIGKGDRERQVALPPEAVRRVDEYLRGRGEGPLLAQWKGRNYGQRMSVRGVQQVLRTLARAAKVPAFSPHDLRRTCVTTALAANVPAANVAAHVGHASVATTVRYQRTDPLELSREVAQKLHLHFSQANAISSRVHL